MLAAARRCTHLDTTALETNRRAGDYENEQKRTAERGRVVIRRGLLASPGLRGLLII